MTSFRLGIHIGDSTLSAALIDTSLRVATSFSVPRSGTLAESLDALVTNGPSRIDLTDIAYVGIVVNVGREAIEHQDLAKVGALRISAPASISVPPAATWPAELAASVVVESAVIGGGHDYTGGELADLDLAAVRSFAFRCRGAVDAIAVTGLCSTVNSDHEQRAAAIIRSVLGHRIPVTLAHEIGGVGLLQRENGAILNAALVRSFTRALRACSDKLTRRGLTGEILIAQNDGTLLSLAEAARRPIFTLESGTPHAMRGAAHLSNTTNAIVAHAEPTMIRFGALVDGYPLESTLPTDIVGIRTHCRMPDLITIRAGRASPLGPDVLSESEQRWCVSAAERLAGPHRDMPLLGVGDSANLLERIGGAAREVAVVEHAAAAAAVGAAVADVSGSIDRTCDYENQSREKLLAESIEAATLAAVRSGADIRHIRIDSVRETPLGYSPGRGARIRVRAVGPVLDLQSR
ncbi:hypothetical protein KL953_01730 [Mycolicibacterium goodii]|uniref:hydantoinase/oxoprolinase N-terminal domain-containing protein n=1 Tax=Mycolicibacterium goodii TaxID=134601 RepID=UPI001BDCB6B8|nr:hydantoinase/oxoprolinase N-terminal domain-containing protein [Mycolicibacterium goodii]MBU8807608.1 hypothetical protein [Mycolicibacterium goodii]ULN47551.1 hypothetical protein MI170_30665 [Mycolicibacterium goodii]